MIFLCVCVYVWDHCFFFLLLQDIITSTSQRNNGKYNTNQQISMIIANDMATIPIKAYLMCFNVETFIILYNPHGNAEQLANKLMWQGFLEGLNHIYRHLKIIFSANPSYLVNMNIEHEQILTQFKKKKKSVVTKLLVISSNRLWKYGPDILEMVSEEMVSV